MKLNELRPAEGSVTPAWRKGRGTGSGNGKQQAKDIKVRTQDPAAVYVRALKAVRFRFTEDFRREASTTSLRPNMP